MIISKSIRLFHFLFLLLWCNIPSFFIKFFNKKFYKNIILHILSLPFITSILITIYCLNIILIIFTIIIFIIIIIIDIILNIMYIIYLLNTRYFRFNSLPIQIIIPTNILNTSIPEDISYDDNIIYIDNAKPINIDNEYINDIINQEAVLGKNILIVNKDFVVGFPCCICGICSNCKIYRQQQNMNNLRNIANIV